MTDKVETALVEGEPVPISALTTALLGSPSLITLKHDTEGTTIKVRITRACGAWVEGDEPEVTLSTGSSLWRMGWLMK